MTRTPLLIAAGVFALAACAAPSGTPVPGDAKARFDWFEYAGEDDVFDAPLAAGEYRNPVIAGFHPDPSIVRVGEDYYLVNSTFGFFPGIPVFHSRDLVNWTQIGNVVDRPGMMPFDGLHLGYNGVYAPAIEYRDGIFYAINTCVGCGGNFVVTATDPAGPWSDPIWLPHIDGIDPSIFFDDDGRTYVVHHRDPVEKRYPAHTAIWLMEVDPVSFAPLSEDVMLVDGGEEAPWPTDYIEGPHLYKIDGRYLLSAPGGGTGYFHGQLTYRSDAPFGPYEPNPDNPVLTQYGLPDDRPDPVTATGHGDFFEDANGDWWIVFLGTRVYDLATPPQDPGRFHTGRETFMLPVRWEDGWPVVLKDAPVPYAVQGPDLPRTDAPAVPTTGNFTLREDFTEAELGPQWLFVRAPQEIWWQTGQGELVITPRSDRMGQTAQPSFVGRRMAHMQASISTRMAFAPGPDGSEAGLMAVQNDAHFYAFGLSRNAAGETVLRVRLRAGDGDPVDGNLLAEAIVEEGRPVWLRIDVDRADVDFAYSLDGEQYEILLDDADAAPLTTAMAGGFTGAVVGMYAQSGAD